MESSSASTALPTVLFIADRASARGDGYAALLSESGYHVIDRTELPAAGPRPSLVIVQMTANAQEALGVCRRVRSTAETCDLPVIVLTGTDDMYTREQSVRAGATSVLSEPVRGPLLVRQVRRLLARAKCRM